jgi:hypothetical protein
MSDARDRAIERLAALIYDERMGMVFGSWPPFGDHVERVDEDESLAVATKAFDSLGLVFVDPALVERARRRCLCDSPGGWCSSCVARDAIADAVLAQVKP